MYIINKKGEKLRNHLKDIVIVILSFILINIIFTKFFDFEYYLNKYGTSKEFNCEIKNIKDIYNSFILYENGSLFYNDINTCTFISREIVSFSNYDKTYLIKNNYSVYNTKLEKINNKEIFEYEEAYHNFKIGNDKLININSKGFILKNNIIYYFDSLYIVNGEIKTLKPLYKESENLFKILDLSNVDSEIIDIYYSINSSKLLIKLSDFYYEIIININNMQEEYEVVKNNKFTNNYDKISFINDDYVIYNDKIWNW